MCLYRCAIMFCPVHVLTVVCVCVYTWVPKTVWDIQEIAESRPWYYRVWGWQNYCVAQNSNCGWEFLHVDNACHYICPFPPIATGCRGWYCNWIKGSVGKIRIDIHVTNRRDGADAPEPNPWCNELILRRAIAQSSANKLLRKVISRGIRSCPNSRPEACLLNKKDST